MGVHRLPSHFLERAIGVVVVGCGGTGSSVAFGLPYLHQSLLAFGHPFGLRVTLIDGDTVSETNCVRQPFSRAEIGLSKAVILATRLNLFWGLQWEAVDGYVGDGPRARVPADLVIGCVDTRAARREILAAYRTSAHYWLDFGNDAETGQFVLGEFARPHVGTTTPARFAKGDRRMDPLPKLPTAADLWPEIVDADAGEDDAPSCSAAEALTRQAPFVNQVLANHGLALLSQLFRHGEIRHHGGFVNLRDGRVTPIPVPEPPAPKATSRKPRSRTRRRQTQTSV